MDKKLADWAPEELRKLSDEALIKESKIWLRPGLTGEPTEYAKLIELCYMEWVRRGRLPVDLAKMFSEKRRETEQKFNFR
jgi:hypothetical protein